MTKAQHTMEWKFRKQRISSGQNQTREVYEIYKPGDSLGDEHIGNIALHQPYARLIAVAPEQHESLQEMADLVDWFLEAYDGDDSLHGKLEAHMKVKKARAAIAKARGE